MLGTLLADPAQLRLGESVVRRQSNAVAQLAFGAQVSGIFLRRATLAPLGGGIQGRDVSFRCMTTDLAQPVQRNSEIIVTFRGAVSYWRVIDVTPLHELGQVLLTLEEA